MAHKASRTSKQLNILLNKNSDETMELKELIIELVQFSIILDKEINSAKAKEAIKLARCWGIKSGKYPIDIRHFQALKRKVRFDLIGFINYETDILSRLGFFDIQHDLRRNISNIYEGFVRNKY